MLKVATRSLPVRRFPAFAVPGVPAVRSIAARRLYTTEPVQAPPPPSGSESDSLSEGQSQIEQKGGKETKICAVPFHFTQADAQERLNIAALLATGTFRRSSFVVRSETLLHDFPSSTRLGIPPSPLPLLGKR